MNETAIRKIKKGDALVTIHGFSNPTIPNLKAGETPINRLLLTQLLQTQEVVTYAKQLTISNEQGQEETRFYLFEKKEYMESNDPNQAFGVLIEIANALAERVKNSPITGDGRLATLKEIERVATNNGYVEVTFVARLERHPIAIVDLKQGAVTAPVDTKVKGEWEQAQERVVNEGILTEEEVQQRVEFLNKHEVSVPLQIAMFNKMIKYPESVQHKIKKPDAEFLDDTCEYIQQGLVGLLFDSQALLLEGPKATGKNLLANTFSWLLNTPMEMMSFNVDLNNDTIFGAKTFQGQPELTSNERRELFLAYFSQTKEDESWKEVFETLSKEEDVETYFESNELANRLANGVELILSLSNGKHELVFDKTQFIDAVEQGFLMVFDEFNLLPPSVSAILHSLYDDNRTLNVPGLGSITPHPNFMTIATQNPPNALYSGTEKNNYATRSRFAVLQLNSLPSIDELLLSKVPQANPKHVQLCNTLYQKIVEVLQTGGNGKRGKDLIVNGASINVKVDEVLLDTRAFVRALKQMDFVKPRLALRSCVLSQSNAPEVVNSIDEYLDLLEPTILN